MGMPDTATFYHFPTARTTLVRSAPQYQGKYVRTPANRVLTATSAHSLPALAASPGAPPGPAPTSSPPLLTARVGTATNYYLTLLPLPNIVVILHPGSYCRYVII